MSKTKKAKNMINDTQFEHLIEFYQAKLTDRVLRKFFYSYLPYIRHKIENISPAYDYVSFKNNVPEDYLRLYVREFYKKPYHTLDFLYSFLRSISQFAFHETTEDNKNDDENTILIHETFDATDEQIEYLFNDEEDIRYGIGLSICKSGA